MHFSTVILIACVCVWNNASLVLGASKRAGSKPTAAVIRKLTKAIGGAVCSVDDSARAAARRRFMRQWHADENARRHVAEIVGSLCDQCYQCEASCDAHIISYARSRSQAHRIGIYSVDSDLRLGALAFCKVFVVPARSGTVPSVVTATDVLKHYRRQFAVAAAVTDGVLMNALTHIRRITGLQISLFRLNLVFKYVCL